MTTPATLLSLCWVRAYLLGTASLPRISCWLVGLLLTGFVAPAQTPTWEWAQALTGPGTSSVYGLKTAVDEARNVYVVGQFSGTLTLGTTTLTSVGDYDVYVAQLSASGAWQWAQRLGSAGADTGQSIAVDTTGHVLVGGSWGTSAFVASFTTAGVPQWLTQAPGTGFGAHTYSVALTPDGTAYAAGTVLGTTTFGSTTLTPTGFANAFVARLNADGHWQWVRLVGGTGGGSDSWALALDEQRYVLVAGSFQEQALFGSQLLTTPAGSKAAFVAQLTPQGEWQWARQSAGSGSAEVQGLAVDAQANVWLTGPFYAGDVTFGTAAVSHVATGADVYVAKLDQQGQWQWARAATGAGSGDVAWAVATDLNGNGYVTGVFTSPLLAFEGLPALVHSSHPAEDLFVSQLDANGVWQWALAAGQGTTAAVGEGIAVDVNRDVTVLGHFWGSSLALDQLLVNATSTSSGSTGYVAHLTNAGWNNVPTVRSHPQPDGSMLLTSSAPRGNQFYRNGERLAGATASSYRVAATGGAGAYTVSTTAAGFTAMTSSPVQVGTVVTSTGETRATASWSVYPNPITNGQFTVQLTGCQGPVQVQLLNALGQVLQERSFLAHPEGQQTVAFDQVSGGVYLLRLQTEQATVTHRVSW